MEHEPDNSKTLKTSLWKLRFNLALILIPSVQMVSDDNLLFVPLLVSLSLSSSIAKSVKLNGNPIFIVVAIVFDIPTWMYNDPFKAGLFKSFVFFTMPVKKGNKIIFFDFLYFF